VVFRKLNHPQLTHIHTLLLCLSHTSTHIQYLLIRHISTPSLYISLSHTYKHTHIHTKTHTHTYIHTHTLSLSHTHTHTHTQTHHTTVIVNSNERGFHDAAAVPPWSLCSWQPRHRTLFDYLFWFSLFLYSQFRQHFVNCFFTENFRTFFSTIMYRCISDPVKLKQKCRWSRFVHFLKCTLCFFTLCASWLVNWPNSKKSISNFTAWRMLALAVKNIKGGGGIWSQFCQTLFFPIFLLSQLSLRILTYKSLYLQ